MELQKAGRCFFMSSRKSELAEPNDEAGDAHLGADIAELRYHAFDEMGKCERSSPWAFAWVAPVDDDS